MSSNTNVIAGIGKRITDNVTVGGAAQWTPTAVGSTANER
jgi:hypothetical protein